MPKKRQAVDLEALGGEIVWTEEGLSIFIPQEVIQHWEAAEFVYDEDEDCIKVYPVEEDRPWK
jgi:hypothetical protein